MPSAADQHIFDERRRRPILSALTTWWRGLRIPDDVKMPLFLVAILATFLSVYFLREMMIPFTVAILLTYLLRPAVVTITWALDYMISCCGARCCLLFQARASRCWRSFWRSACGWLQCCTRKERLDKRPDSRSSGSGKGGSHVAKPSAPAGGKAGKAGADAGKLVLAAKGSSSSSGGAAAESLLTAEDIRALQEHKRGGSTGCAAPEDDDEEGDGAETRLITSGSNRSGSSSSSSDDPESLSKKPVAASSAAAGSGPGGGDGSDAAAADASSRFVDPTEFYSVRCTRLIAVLLAVALAVGVIALLVLVVVDSIHAFADKYWPTFSARFDAVMHNIVAWIHDNLHFDASSLLNLKADTLAKELGSASTLVGIAQAVMVIVVTLLFMMFLLLDERFDGGVVASRERADALGVKSRRRPIDEDEEDIDGSDSGDEDSSGEGGSGERDSLLRRRGGGGSSSGLPADDRGRPRDPDGSSGSTELDERSTAALARAADRASARDRAVDAMWADIDESIHRYLMAKTLVSVAMGLLVFIVLGPILHVKLAHLFGVLTVILNFIPNVGALIAALVPLPIILLDPELSGAAQALAILLPLAIHFVIGNFVEPFVLGPLLSLHPVVVLLALSFWYVLWGVGGAVLAIPLTSVVAIALKASHHAYAAFIVCLLEEFRIDLSLLRQGRTRPLPAAATGGASAPLLLQDEPVAATPSPTAGIPAGTAESAAAP